MGLCRDHLHRLYAVTQEAIRFRWLISRSRSSRIPFLLEYLNHTGISFRIVLMTSSPGASVSDFVGYSSVLPESPFQMTLLKCMGSERAWSELLNTMMELSLCSVAESNLALSSQNLAESEANKIKRFVRVGRTRLRSFEMPDRTRRVTRPADCELSSLIAT